MSSSRMLLDWLDEQDFFEMCQQYRHSVEWRRGPGDKTTVEAFEALKAFISEAAITDASEMIKLLRRAFAALKDECFSQAVKMGDRYETPSAKVLDDIEAFLKQTC